MGGEGGCRKVHRGEMAAFGGRRALVMSAPMVSTLKQPRMAREKRSARTRWLNCSAVAWPLMRMVDRVQAFVAQPV